MKTADKITAAVATLRKNVDDFYANRITYERFQAMQRAVWALIEADAPAVKRGVQKAINDGARDGAR